MPSVFLLEIYVDGRPAWCVDYHKYTFDASLARPFKSVKDAQDYITKIQSSAYFVTEHSFPQDPLGEEQ